MAAQPGDPVTLIEGDGKTPGRITAMSSWTFICARLDGGRLVLEVMFDLSAVSWPRVLELDPSMDDRDVDLLEKIAQVARRDPRHPIPPVKLGARHFLAPEVRLDWVDPLAAGV